jgi:putative hemolysin
MFSKRLDEVDLKKIMRPAFYVPESKKVNHLLKELQREKVHMAIVLDEYGGTAGIVTIEDLIEEIVGDILDEYDADENLIQEIDDSTLVVSSRVGVDEINELLALSYPEDEFETISGFIFNILGRIPIEGDILEFQDSKITVLKVLDRTIQQAKIEKLKTILEK